MYWNTHFYRPCPGRCAVRSERAADVRGDDHAIATSQHALGHHAMPAGGRQHADILRRAAPGIPVRLAGDGRMGVRAHGRDSRAGGPDAQERREFLQRAHDGGADDGSQEHGLDDRPRPRGAGGHQGDRRRRGDSARALRHFYDLHCLAGRRDVRHAGEISAIRGGRRDRMNILDLPLHVVLAGWLLRRIASRLEGGIQTRTAEEIYAATNLQVRLIKSGLRLSNAAAILPAAGLPNTLQRLMLWAIDRYLAQQRATADRLSPFRIFYIRREE